MTATVLQIGQCVRCESGYLCRKPRRGKARSYCSDECSRAVREERARQKRMAAKGNCEECGTPLPPWKQYLCSTACKQRARWRRLKADPVRYRAYLDRSANVRHRRRRVERASDLTGPEVIALKAVATRCPLCDCELTDDHTKSNARHLDHIVPLAAGGTHTRGNVRVTCASCNMRRPHDGSDLEGRAFHHADAA